MTTKTTSKLICDACGNEVYMDNAYETPEGWWELMREIPVPKNSDKKYSYEEYDLCSEGCLVKKAHEIRGF